VLLNIYSPRAAATEFSDDVLQQKTTTTVTTNFSGFFVVVIIAITTFVRAIDQLLDSRRIGGVTNLNLNFLFKKKTGIVSIRKGLAPVISFKYAESCRLKKKIVWG
jgi:hypothetical protein